MWLITTQNLTYKMQEKIKRMMEPIRFGQAMADRLLGISAHVKVKSLLTFTKGDYKDICLRMEQLMCDVMHQRELWKDRFFFHASYSDENDFCNTCKEEMRQAFLRQSSWRQDLQKVNVKDDDLGRFPFDQNFRNFRSETEWNGKNSGKSFRKFRNTFWVHPLW